MTLANPQVKVVSCCWTPQWINGTPHSLHWLFFAPTVGEDLWYLTKIFYSNTFQPGLQAYTKIIYLKIKNIVSVVATPKIRSYSLMFIPPRKIKPSSTAKGATCAFPSVQWFCVSVIGHRKGGEFGCGPPPRMPVTTRNMTFLVGYPNSQPKPSFTTVTGRGHTQCIYFWSNYSDLTRPHPKWWFSKGNPLISGKSRLVKYYNLTRYLYIFGFFSHMRQLYESIGFVRTTHALFVSLLQWRICGACTCT